MDMTRKKETATVKRAIIAAGFDQNNVRVTHGHGTAWGWLTVHLDLHHKPGCACFFDGINPETRADECKTLWSAAYHRIIEVAMAATGRHGEYDGRISVNMGFFDKKPFTGRASYTRRKRSKMKEKYGVYPVSGYAGAGFTNKREAIKYARSITDTLNPKTHVAFTGDIDPNDDSEPLVQREFDPHLDRDRIIAAFAYTPNMGGKTFPCEF